MDLILAEKYRPKTIDECVLPAKTKDMIKGFVSNGTLPSLLFVGGAGVGKTTVARAIANEIGADLLFINASMESGVDNIRTKVTQFASSVSFTDSKKITVLDEADGLSNASQQALRGFIEEFSGNHSIIFTANYANKIIDPIVSRCKVVDFKIPSADKPAIAAAFIKRIYSILKSESIDYDKEVIAELVMKKFPDFRSILNELQGYSAGGKIDSGILLNISESAFDSLITILKNKKFNDLRKWVSEHSDIDSDYFYDMFYKRAFDKLENKSMLVFIAILSEYSYRAQSAMNKDINKLSFLTELLKPEIVWK